MLMHVHSSLALQVVFLGISSPWDVASVLLAANERGMNSSSSYVWTTPEDKSRVCRADA